MLIGQTGFVVVLALFLAFSGLVAVVIAKSFRDGERARDVAGNVILLAIVFAAVSLLALELVLPEIEAALIR